MSSSPQGDPESRLARRGEVSPEQGEPARIVLFMKTWLGQALCWLCIDTFTETGYRVQSLFPWELLSWLQDALLDGARPVAIVLDDGILDFGGSGRYMVQSLRRLYRTHRLPVPPLIMITERRNYPEPSSIGFQTILALPFSVRELVDALHQHECNWR